MRRAFALAAALALLPGQAPQPELPPEAQAIVRRAQALPLDRAVESPDLYTPAENVRGGKGRAFAVDPGAVPAAALDDAVRYAEAQNSFALIVARDGKIVRERYWPGFGPESRFSTASMHKTVMALAYGPAVARGRIALDDPVGRWLPEWAEDPRGRISIRQLLQMASGLAVPPFTPAPSSPAMALMFGADIGRVALALPADAPPGSAFAYANGNAQLAGMALERATGMRYADWLSRTIWRPIGAGDATVWLDRPGGAPHFFCCLQATARDWLRVGELIRNAGKAGGRQVVPAGWIREMATPSPANPNYGLQLWLGSPHAPARRYSKVSPVAIPAREPFDASDVVFLDGAGGQRVYVVPSAGLTVVRIGKPAPAWDDSAMVNMLLRGLAR